MFQGNYNLNYKETGKITFYNNVKCGIGEMQVKECPVSVTDSILYGPGGRSTPMNINIVCPDWKQEKILSFRIDGPEAVVLFGNGETCKYWDKDIVDKEGNCIGYDNFLVKQNPQSFIIIPYNKKLN